MNKVMAGIDLHSNNLVVGIVDSEGKRLGCRKLDCDLKEVEQFLRPFKSRLQQVAVESTYNWYWLVDGLQASDYPVVLANPAAIQQYNGIKHVDDTHDAFFLAELSRLKILPTGYVYDAKLRPVRDLLRRRQMLVHQRTALMLSFKALYARSFGQQMSLGYLKKLEVQEAEAIYQHPANKLIAGMQIQHVEQLSQSIEQIEKVVLAAAKELPYYPKLTTLPGVGKILGMTISMEVGDIKRFASCADFSSYCRTVAAKRISNQKKKADNNAKCGNKYLAWAFIEAANFARLLDGQCRKWYERKAARTSNVIATKALACKLAKAAWHLMVAQTDYDAQRMFGQPATTK